MKPAIWFAAGAACALVIGKAVPVAVGGGTTGNAATMSSDMRIATTASGDVFEYDGGGYHFRGNALASRPSTGRIVGAQYFRRFPADFVWVVLNTGEQYSADVVPDGTWVFHYAGNCLDGLQMPAGPSTIAHITYSDFYGGTMILESGDVYGGGSGYPSRDYLGNIFANVPVGVDNTTWSKVKASYR